MSKQSMEERLREKLAKILVGYDKRYTVASLSILLDKMMVSINKTISQAKREERERFEHIVEILRPLEGKSCEGSGIYKNTRLGVWVCGGCGKVFVTLEQAQKHKLKGEQK